MSIIKNKKGSAALFTILVLSAVALLMAKSATLIGIDHLDIINLTNIRQELEYAIEGCADDTLIKILRDNAYSAINETLSLGDVSCIININKSNNQRTIEIEGSKEIYRKKLLIDLNIVNEKLILNNWKFIGN